MTKKIKVSDRDPMSHLHSRAENGDHPYMVIWWFPLGDPIAWVSIQGSDEVDAIEQAWGHPQAEQVADEIVRRSLLFKMTGHVTARPLPDLGWQRGGRRKLVLNRNVSGQKNQKPIRRKKGTVARGKAPV